jgi:hypothetical protein
MKHNLLLAVWMIVVAVRLSVPLLLACRAALVGCRG